MILVEIERFSLPLSTPLETAAGPIQSREGFVVRIERDGVTGLGEATPLAGWTESIDACETVLEAIDDPIRAFETSLSSGADDPFEGHPAARHGVSLAVLDAAARAATEPLYRHLGADTEVTRVPANATVGDATPSATADAVAGAVGGGFETVKLKVGARALEEDFERLEAVRARCPDVKLRADANAAWTFQTARRALDRFDRSDVSFVEQPLAVDALKAHAKLRSVVDIGVALDETVATCGIESVLESGAADVVVLKPMALGGIDRAWNAARQARANGIEPVVTTTVDGAIARAAAVHLAASLAPIRACGVATGDRLAKDLRSEIAPVRDGFALVPHGKGNIPLG